MKVIDCDWKKRNGNGQSVCHLCKALTWDSWCYDFELKILDEELFNSVLCGDCILKIKNELKCKMAPREEIIEEEQNIKELWIDDSGYIHTELGSWKGRKMDIAFATKINEVVKEVNKQKNNEEVL